MNFSLTGEPMTRLLYIELVTTFGSNFQHCAADVIAAALNAIRTYTALGNIPILSFRPANNALHGHLHWLVAEL
jgi:hypothetical protein